MMKTVFHVTEPDLVSTAIGAVRNLLEDDSLAVTEINLVANGRSVKEFTKTANIVDEVEGILSDIVKIKMCNNSLTAFNVEDLIDGIEVVPSGVGELRKLQSYRYAYIRI